jgi:hypothetical protein
MVLSFFQLEEPARNALLQLEEQAQYVRVLGSFPVRSDESHGRYTGSSDITIIVHITIIIIRLM